MAYALVPLINGKQHEFADITVNILGVPFGGVTKISYATEQEMKNVYAAGTKVYGRVYGQEMPTASISMLAKELENIQTVAVGGRIQSIPEFTITITYIDAAMIPVKHQLLGCRFTKNSRESQRGDGEIEVEVGLIIADVKWL